MKARYLPVLMGGKQKYYQKILSIQRANLIGFWRLNETSGATAVDISGQGNNGTYTGVDLANAAGPDGVLIPYFDGAADYVNLFSAALAADVSKAAGTIALWVKPVNGSYWAAVGTGWMIELDFLNNSNTIYIGKVAANVIRAVYQQGATSKVVDLAPSGAGLVHLGMTWDTVADAMKGYRSGAQVGVTQTGLVQPTGSLTTATLGARNITPTSPFNGWEGLVALWKTALTPAEMLNVATV
jgi:hypothetical protein